MMRRHFLLALILAFLQAACGSVPVERFYRIDALEPVADNHIRPPMKRLSVGPVSLTEVLDRPQMVWLIGPQQVLIAEQSRWAEPLPSAVSRVVADNLTRQLTGLLPVSPHAEADIRIELDIRRLDAEPGRAVTLEAVWSIDGADGRVSGQMRVREAVTSTATDDLVAAHARALHRLSQAIAADLNNPPR